MALKFKFFFFSLLSREIRGRAHVCVVEQFRGRFSVAAKPKRSFPASFTSLYSEE